ncbi:MAG: MoaD/ThiS family protein [Pseudomonadota bacterium]
MASVQIPRSLTRLTGGEEQLSLVADSYRSLIRALDGRFPGLGEELAKLAVAIDGTIYQTPLLEPLTSDSEIFFLPRIEGG